MTELSLPSRSCPGALPSTPTSLRPASPLGAAVLLCVLAIIIGFQTQGRAAPKEEYRKPVVIHLDGIITPLTQEFIERRLETAREMGSNLVIIEIDSPGGLVDPSFGIAGILAEISWATTVAYVPKQALSGAAFVALGCEHIIIDPGARIGDAGPIVMGEDSLFRHAPEKIVSDLAVRVRQLAEIHNRPAGLAEAMVKKDLEVFEVTNKETGVKTYMTEAEIQDAADPETWQKGKLVFESRDDHFLEVTGARALELGLADATAQNMEDVQKHFGLERPPIRLKSTWVDTLVYVLNSTFVTILLLVIGLVCLYVELHAPGIGVAGITAGLCFSLFFWSKFLGGTAGWLEIVLFILGVACMAMELFVIPGFGVMGVSGILLIVSSFVLASQTFIFPHTTADFYAMGRSLRDLGIVVGIFLGLAAFLSRYFEHLPILGSMILMPDADEQQDVVAGSADEPGMEESLAALVGLEGVTRTPLRPAGKVRLADHRVLDVVAEGEFVETGQRVRVMSVEGNRVVVRQIS